MQNLPVPRRYDPQTRFESILQAIGIAAVCSLFAVPIVGLVLVIALDALGRAIGSDGPHHLALGIGWLLTPWLWLIWWISVP